MAAEAVLFDSFERVRRIEEPFERREGLRFPLQLSVAVVYHHHQDPNTRPTYRGKTCDVSMRGLSLLVEHNVFTENEITVLIALPPSEKGAPQEIIEATARMVYTVLSSEHDAFRIGISLRQFKRNGAKRLQAILAERFEAARSPQENRC